MVHAPLRRTVEQRRRRVEEDGRAAREEDESERRAAGKGQSKGERDAPLDERLVALLRVLLGGVPEVAARDGATDAVVVLAAREDVVLVPAGPCAKGQLPRPRFGPTPVEPPAAEREEHDDAPVHDAEELLADVLRATHGATLDVVLGAPRVAAGDDDEGQSLRR